MAKSTGVILVVGGITFANQVLFQPLASGGGPGELNWKIIPATAVAAALLTGVEKLSPDLAVGIAYISLVTVVFARIDGRPAPVENVAKVLGY